MKILPKKVGNPIFKLLDQGEEALPLQYKVEIIYVEDLCFFQKGKAAIEIRDGATSRKGKIPINPSGGLKSKGHPIGATGIGQIVEVFEQFSGQAGERTIKDAEIALTHNFGATGASAAVHIFKKVN